MRQWLHTSSAVRQAWLTCAGSFPPSLADGAQRFPCGAPTAILGEGEQSITISVSYHLQGFSPHEGCGARIGRPWYTSSGVLLTSRLATCDVNLNQTTKSITISIPSQSKWFPVCLRIERHIIWNSVWGQLLSSFLPEFHGEMSNFK